MNAMMDPTAEAEHKQFFDQADANSDGMCNKEEGVEWFKMLLKEAEYDDLMKKIWSKLSAAILCVNAETGAEFMFADW